MPEIFIGTSGWSYAWNPEKSLDWYVLNSGFNAIELNMSYYRFPYANMVKSWSKKGESLAWVIKVHRSITHYGKLYKKTYNTFRKFIDTFNPLKDYIHYYLLQLPPKFKDLDTVQTFVDEFNDVKLAIEFRNSSMFNDEVKAWGKENEVLLVSVDAPGLPRTIMSESIIYERIHGRTEWYSHVYSDDELKEIKEIISIGNPERVYVFFNNDHGMLENGRNMLRLLNK